MIEPDHVTGCEHQPIEFRRVSRMQKNSILKILRTTERKGVSNHPATFAFSTKYQMIQRVLVHLRRGCRSTVFLCEYCSISTHIDVDRPPGIGWYWKPRSLLKSMKLKVFDIVSWLGRNPYCEDIYMEHAHQSFDPTWLSWFAAVPSVQDMLRFNGGQEPQRYVPLFLGTQSSGASGVFSMFHQYFEAHPRHCLRNTQLWRASHILCPFCSHCCLHPMFDGWW